MQAGSGGGGGLGGSAGGAGLGAAGAGGAAHMALPAPALSINPAAHYASARSWGGKIPLLHSVTPRRSGTQDAAGTDVECALLGR